MKVFCSGSCRLLSSVIQTCDVEPIHTLEEPHFKGINFVGKFHDTKSHIQFIRFLKGEIELDSDILRRFFTAYNNEKWQNIRYFEPLATFAVKINNIKRELDNCEAYIFEVCSLKVYNYKGWYCQWEQMPDNDISDYDVRLQNEDELLNDLYHIKSYFPNKKIIFQCHFRPNIIYDDDKKTIVNREMIFNTLTKFCKNNPNCFVHDPSILLAGNHALFDGDTHFTNIGYIENCKYLHENFIMK